MLGKANEVVIELGGVDCPALIDTGSMVSSVSEKFYQEHLQSRYPMVDLKTDIRVEGAGGNKLDFLGVVEVEICFSKSSQNQLLVPMFIMHNTSYNQTTPTIIGTNVLALVKNDADSSFPHAIADAIAVLCQHSQRMVEDVNLYAHSPITLPPKKVTVITARVGVTSNIQYGVPSAVENLPGGVTLPQCMVSLDHKSQKTNMCLVNITDHEICIPRLQKLAVVQPARIIDATSSHDEENVLQYSTQSQVAPPCTGEKDVPVDLDDTDLTEKEKYDVKELLNKYSDVFAFSKSELGTAKGVKHTIKLTDSQPFKDRPR